MIKPTELHGLSKHPLYTVWAGMIARCTNPLYKQYEDYGGRGITVCDEWRMNFRSFYDWAIAQGYEKGLQLDRTNNELGYSPENCAWQTPTHNGRNKRSNHMLTAFGETKAMSAWVDDPRCSVGYSTLRSRIRYGWPAERAISQKCRYDREQ